MELCRDIPIALGPRVRCPTDALLQGVSQQINGLSTQRPGDLDELDHIDAPLADLNFCNERLRALETPRQFLLTDHSFFAGFHERRTKHPVSTGSQGFQEHAPPG